MQRKDKLTRADIRLTYLNEAIEGDAASLADSFTFYNTKEGHDHWWDQYVGDTPLDIPRLKEIRSNCFPEYQETTEQEPKLWKDMTPEEKGALLLAHHEGKVIEGHSFRFSKWYNTDPNWRDTIAYRVKPEPEPEPKVNTVTMGVMNNANGWQAYTNLVKVKPYYRITFDTIDGEPDRKSIKMEIVE